MCYLLQWQLLAYYTFVLMKIFEIATLMSERKEITELDS